MLPCRSVRLVINGSDTYHDGNGYRYLPVCIGSWSRCKPHAAAPGPSIAYSIVDTGLRVVRRPYRDRDTHQNLRPASVPCICSETGLQPPSQSFVPLLSLSEGGGGLIPLVGWHATEGDRWWKWWGCSPCPKARPEINHYDEIPDTMPKCQLGGLKKKKGEIDMSPFPVDAGYLSQPGVLFIFISP